MAPRDHDADPPPAAPSGQADAEERLRESQDLLVKALDVGHIGAWRSDAHGGRLLWWSPETYRIFGLEPRFADFNRPVSRCRPSGGSRGGPGRCRRRHRGACAVRHRAPHRPRRRRRELGARARRSGLRRATARRSRLVGVVQDITDARLTEKRLALERRAPPRHRRRDAGPDGRVRRGRPLRLLEPRVRARHRLYRRGSARRSRHLRAALSPIRTTGIE